MSLLRIMKLLTYRNCDHNQCVYIDIHIDCGSHDRQPIIIIISWACIYIAGICEGGFCRILYYYNYIYSRV